MKKLLLLSVAFAYALCMNAMAGLKLSANSDGSGDINIGPGTTITAYVYANLGDNFAGAQFDLYLPTGIEITKAVAGSILKDEDGETIFSFSKKEYSQYTRFLIYSVENRCFSPWDGDMVKLTLKASDNFNGGTGYFKHMVFSRPGAASDEPNDASFQIYKMTTPATSITLSQNSLMMNKGDVVDITATVLPAAASQEVVWKSSNTNVASVTSGIIQAYNSGSAIITATTTDGTNLSASCNVTVIGDNMPDTDISTYDNIIYVLNQDMYTGSQVVMPVYMKNSTSIVGFQCDIVLPAGVSIAQNDGDYLIELAENRTTYKKHSLSYNKLSDGSMRLVCVSMNNATFSGNDGVVVFVTLDIAKQMQEGQYPVFVKNIETTTATGTLFDVDLCKSTLNIIQRIMGDVNKDKKISVADAACAVSIILGTELPSWDKPAADMNNDGDVTVADVASIVNIILSGGSSAKGEEFVNHSDPDVVLNQNGNALSFGLNGFTNEFVAMQFDVRTNARIQDILPTTSSKNHLMTFSQISAGLYRVVVYSVANSTFAGFDGDLVNIAFDMQANNNYNVEVSNIELVRSDLSTSHPASQAVSMNPTGITENRIQNSESGDIYNLNGIRVNDNYKGIRIINGKKIFVK